MNSQNENELERRSLEFQEEFISSLTSYRQRLGHLILNESDRLRLLTLKAWTQRYRVNLDFILRVLFGYYDKKVRSKTRIRSGVGVRIATLTSKTSRNILESAILENFPNGENESEWKQQHREQILKIYGQEDFSRHHPMLDPVEYRRQMFRFRQHFLDWESKLASRPYRDNPFKQ